MRVAVGPDGELVFDALLAGIDPAAAWAILELVDHNVLPFLAAAPE